MKLKPRHLLSVFLTDGRPSYEIIITGNWSATFSARRVKLRCGTATKRDLYEYAEYTSPSEIRIAGKILYVGWVNPLFGPTHWLLAYDLVGRREITRRRIDPSD